MFYSELPDVADGIDRIPAGEVRFVITHPDFRGAHFDGRLVTPEEAASILEAGEIELGGETFEVREPKVRRFNSARLDHSRDFEILRGKKQAVLVTPGKYVIHSKTFDGGHVQSVRPDFVAVAMSAGLYDLNAKGL